MNAGELFKAGRLAEAIAAATDEVKRHPTDSSKRGLLAELLCFAGQWERADLHLDALGQQDPQAMMGISMFRQLIRGEQARQQFFTEGRVPEFLDKPSPCLQLHLEASIRIREGNFGEAVTMLEQAEELRPKVHGVWNSERFDDLRDLDDLVAPVFEVVTSTGKYYWIPIERVELIECRAPARPRDLLWRQVHMVVTDGPDGEVFLPTLYAGAHAETDDLARLGRKTDWRGGEGSPVRGVGQRSFLVGQSDHTILEFKELTIETRPADCQHDPSES
jgi:type VI secretion system protein ImpE